MAGSHRRPFGTVRKLPSGRWQARIWNEATGRHVPAPHTFTSKGEANRWVSSAELVTRRHGSYPDLRRGDVPLQTYASEWLAERPLRPRTRELYESQLRCHIVPELGASPLNRITAETVRRWHATLLSTGLHQVTVAKVYRLLRTMLGTAVEDQLLMTNPCQVRGGGVERSPERPIPTLRDVERLADGLPSHLRAVVWIAALGGLRKGEIFALARCHIHLDRRVIRVERALQEIRGRGAEFVPPKTAASVRMVVMPDVLAEIVASHLIDHTGPDPLDLLFTNSRGSPIRATVWTAAWSAAQRHVAVDIRLHDLRHLAGTLAAQAGATLKETMDRLGHTTPNAALRYQHVASERAAFVASGIDSIVRR